MARARTAPDARSRSAREAGTALPCASATARRGVSTWESGALATPLVILDMLDYALGESGGRALGGAGHQPREIVRDASRPARAAGPAGVRRRHVVPPELLEHHRPRENHASRVHLVLAGVLGCGAVRRLEHGVPVGYVASRREPEPAYLRGRGIREQVAVQVGCGDHGILVRPQHELCEHRVGNPIFDDHLSRVPVSRVCLGDGLRAEPLACDLVPPLPEPALRELHDVALVHERDRAATGAQRVLDRLRDQALGAELGHRFDADRAPGTDLGAEPLGEEPDHRIGLGAAGAVLDSGVHVLDVLAKDHDVELLRLAPPAGHALEIAYRPDAGVQVEHLAQRHVEGADPSPNGRRKRAFDGHAVRADGLERGLGKPGPDLFEGLLTGQHLEPIDLAFAAGHLPHRGVEYAPGGAPDVGPGAVAFDERDDGVARHHPPTVAIFDALAHGQAVYTARPGLRQAKQRPYT